MAPHMTMKELRELAASGNAREKRSATREVRRRCREGMLVPCWERQKR